MIVNIRQTGETLEHSDVAAIGGLAARDGESQMGLTFFRRYFRARNVYWNVMRELSCYTDRELHDLGIDRADIPGIARTAAQQA